MKKLIVILMLSTFTFANETNIDEFNQEFENEFSSQSQTEVFDPLSGYNRVMTSFNDGFFMNVLNPVATGYSKVLPENLRISISNFFHNITFPVRLANNLLQLKFQNSAEETGRFVVNTIWGVVGFLDPAKEQLGWQAHNEDFGQTLGYWGVGEGFHIVLPFLGPSNLRDTVGLVADSYVNPLSEVAEDKVDYKIPKNSLQQLGIVTVDTVNETSLKLGQYENLKKDALDLYPFLRDIYTQNRNKLIEE